MFFQFCSCGYLHVLLMSSYVILSTLFSLIVHKFEVFVAMKIQTKGVKGSVERAVLSVYLQISSKSPFLSAMLML